MPVRSKRPSAATLEILCRLLIPLDRHLLAPAELAAAADPAITAISRENFDELVALAHSNHVVIRALGVFLAVMRHNGDTARAEWAESALAEEQARINHAIPFLHAICSAFEEEDLDITVMKSLDHWPDLGSDLDLFSNASAEDVQRLLQRRFQATMSERSWGDRLARKFNFEIPGLPESVEFHVGRLGQTGEQMTLAKRLPQRARVVELNGLRFRVPHASDRLMISTLQRMYRHFYFRLCDIIDSGTLVTSGAVDFNDLERSARAAGIWEGTASYLAIVSDYLKAHGDPGLALPRNVLDAARFGGDCVYFARDFIRVPIVPQSTKLYVSQFTGLLRSGELKSSARLSLLPWLATAALVEQKRTGSDKGIW
jgi:hypothetical protein